MRNPIDRFILARLEREGLHPAAEADKATLIRRVTLDLTGLPPTPAEVDAFLQDTSPDAYEKVVDRLLASPRYGERMAFRWMEAARYADTNGYQTDGPRDMWRWRDWVIDAFNRNMPFDQFTIEQMAGDLLPNATLDQHIATGFNRNHRTNGEGGIIPEEYRVEYVVDRAQTTSTVWMGLTVGCARCHDHKYDPISQKEFYRLFAYFNRIPDEKGFVWNYGNEEPLVKAPLPEHTQKLAELDRQVAAAQARFDGHAARYGVGVPRRAGIPIRPGGYQGSRLRCRRDGLLVASRPACATLRRQALPGSRRQDCGLRLPRTLHFRGLDQAREPERRHRVSRRGLLRRQGHGLYLMDGKIRAAHHRRLTDLGMRVETVEPVKLHQWQHVLVTYDGGRKASGVQIYVNGQPQAMKVLFDQNLEPIHHPKTPFRIGAGGGLRFTGSIDESVSTIGSLRRRLPRCRAESSAVAAMPEPRAHAAQAKVAPISERPPRMAKLAALAAASARNSTLRFPP